MRDVILGVAIFLLICLAVWIILSVYHDLLGLAAGLFVWVIMAIAGVL